MKTLLLIALIFLLGSLSLIHSIRNSGTMYKTEVVALRDITEANGTNPDANEVISLFDFSDHPNQAAVFHYRLISDVSYTPVQVVELKGVNRWLSNEIDRQDAISGFQKDIANAIKTDTEDKLGKSMSSIYLPIREELFSLSESKAQKRVAVIYSDLLENEPSFSLYGPKSLQQANSETVKKSLEAHMQLPPLTGIEVYLIYEPKEISDNQRYLMISGIYKNILEEHGALVHIGANLQN